MKPVSYMKTILAFAYISRLYVVALKHTIKSLHNATNDKTANLSYREMNSKNRDKLSSLLQMLAIVC